MECLTETESSKQSLPEQIQKNWMLNFLNIHLGILGNQGHNIWAAQETYILSRAIRCWELGTLVRTGVPPIPSTHTKSETRYVSFSPERRAQMASDSTRNPYSTSWILSHHILCLISQVPFVGQLENNSQGFWGVLRFSFACFLVNGRQSFYFSHSIIPRSTTLSHYKIFACHLFFFEEGNFKQKVGEGVIIK